MTAARPLSGLRLVPAYLDRPSQEALLAALRAVFARAPLYVPRMPNSGKPLSVRMTNCGPLGWVTDEAGYRYQPLHPHTGQPWPAMPDLVIDAWKSLAGYSHAPESCLINYYGPAAKMGLH
jgi:alkylated DNA repair protein (DNA oxidative demethylase)